MSFTLAELEKALEEYDEEYIWSELGYSEFQVEVNGVPYTTEPVKDIGGEGQGDYAAVIFKVDGRLFRKEGWYASHHGSEYDGDFEEVEEYTKMVSDYRAV